MNLKTCDTHGMHQGDVCPKCDEAGRDAARRGRKPINPLKLPATLRLLKKMPKKHPISPNLAPQSPKTVQDSGKATPKPRGHKTMNGTERRFAERLELQRIAGEIKGFAYEGITLKWGTDESGRGMRYTADFAVFENDGSISLHEVKNAFIWGKDKTRYQGCKAQWEKHFKFTMWQWKGGVWKQIL